MCVFSFVDDILLTFSFQNVNLAQPTRMSSFDFVDVLAEVKPPEPSADPSTPTLRPLFDRVASKVGPNATPTLVILDDVTSLQWIGFSFLDITRFTRALRALCLKVCLLYRLAIILSDR
jgi:hypothetical protein